MNTVDMRSQLVVDLVDGTARPRLVLPDGESIALGEVRLTPDILDTLRREAMATARRSLLAEVQRRGENDASWRQEARRLERLERDAIGA